MILALLTVVFFLGIFFIVKKVQNGNQKENLPPGPWGLPLLGHLVFLGLNPHLTLMKWKKKHGPIIHFQFGSFPAVALCDSKVIREAFNMNEFSGRPKIQVYHENNLGKGLILSEGSYNTELRQFTVRKLKEFGMGRKTLEDQIHEGISEFMDFIKEREELPIKSEDVPSAHILRTLWSIMMSSEPDPQEIEHLNHLVHEMSKIGPVLSELACFLPWIEKMVRSLSFGHCSLISSKGKSVQELLAFVAKLLEQKKSNWEKGQSQGQSEAPVDIMDMYLEKVAATTDKSSPFHASQDAAKNFVNDIFVGGIHTLQATLVWLLNYTARNPEVQLKLQEEIDEVIGNSRLPSLSDRGQMPYAEAIVNELLRMGSVFPLAFPHNTLADVRFHGYTIKKDTMVFANTYGVHYDPEVWDDPQNFRPERWLGEQGKKLRNEHFFPFSTGKRNCVGEGLAREQLFLYVTTLFQKYRVDFDRGRVPEVKGVFATTLFPSKFTVVFNQRKI